jgi:hypothetical protein
LIAKYTPAAISLLPGDTFAEVTGGWQQKRGAATVATFLRKDMTRTVLTAAFFINSAVPFAFYREEHMPGTLVTMTDVARSGEIVRFKFANGTEREFPTLEAAKSAVEYLDSEDTTGEDALILKAIRNSPDGANLETMIGASFSADFNANVPFVLTQE